MAADVLLRAVDGGGVYVVLDYTWNWITARRKLSEAFGPYVPPSKDKIPNGIFDCTVKQAAAVLRLNGFTVIVEE